MMMTLGLAAIALTALLSDLEADFIARVESTQLLVNHRPLQRIEKNAEGNVVRLRLDGMCLSADDFGGLARLTTLRSLSLQGTNVTSADLRHLQGLPQLEALNLSATGISDDAVGEIMK